MLIELVLTIGLAGIIYFEGEVSSKLAVIQGNKLYSKAVTRLADQNLTWFSQQFTVYLADKFNHVPHIAKLGLREGVHRLAQFPGNLQKHRHPNRYYFFHQLQQKKCTHYYLLHRHHLHLSSTAPEGSLNQSSELLRRPQV